MLELIQIRSNEASAVEQGSATPGLAETKTVAPAVGSAASDATPFEVGELSGSLADDTSESKVTEPAEATELDSIADQVNELGHEATEDTHDDSVSAAEVEANVAGSIDSNGEVPDK